MRIVVINQFFWPDVAPTGQYLSDVARHLASQGHDVTVICSGNSYGDAESDGQPAPAVEIVRIKGLPFRRGAIARLLSYVTFFAGALGHAMRMRSADMIVSMTTPPMLSVVGALVKGLRGTQHFIWEMDVFPEALVTTGTMRRNLLVKLLSSIQRAVRRHSDGVIALGPCMQALLVADGTPAKLVHVAENWADSRSILAQQPSTSGQFHVMYSGNLGRAHDVGTINDAIRYFRNDPRLKFSFSGRGVGRDWLKQVCVIEDIQNVKFPKYVNRSEMSDHLAQADVGLVTQLPACVGTVVPSKVYGLMAAGRPILFIGPKEATPSLLIERFKCGWQVDPGDARTLITLLESFCTNREEVATRGLRALEAFREHYDLPHGVARVTAALGLGDPAETATEPIGGEVQSSRVKIAFSA